MPDSITKTQRLLDLVAYLAGRRFPAAVDEIIEAVPSYGRQAWVEGTETERQSLRRKFEREESEWSQINKPVTAGACAGSPLERAAQRNRGGT